MNVYGESTYKGYVIKRNRQTKKAISKHYISAIDNVPLAKNKLNIYMRDKYGDIVLSNYEIGQNKKVDNGIRAWFIARRKAKRSTVSLTRSQFSKLFSKKY